MLTKEQIGTSLYDNLCINADADRLINNDQIHLVVSTIIKNHLKSNPY